MARQGSSFNKQITKNNFQKHYYSVQRCRSSEHQWRVYAHSSDGSATDRLAFLPSGQLRHYIVDLSTGIDKAREIYGPDDVLDQEDNIEIIHYDYPFGSYCADKAILSRDNIVATYALICVPEITARWRDADYLLKHAVDPVFRAIAIACYLVVAIVYFVLPQLRDLVGNSITSMCMCMVTYQVATGIRTFTDFGNHINFMIIGKCEIILIIYNNNNNLFVFADAVSYIALLSAFFWLNALGYYVWITFRSRNVYLRVTDKKKYCYYSFYVWGTSLSIGATAVFAHLTLETNKPLVRGITFPAQETIGWLGVSVLFMSVAFTIVVDLCFILTTSNTIKRMSTYGRIHHKMKYNFRMFVLLFAIMSLSWLLMLFAQLKYEALFYTHVFANLLQALGVLWVTVFGQKRVTFLLGKTCNCCSSAENPEGLDWGEEMTAINAVYG